ncbi:MAG: signal peptidase I [Symbiopectobacterium sp.]|uniref:signal peptidase I n=1 Tax=Symbiopectobacterium sp. TaxID=2952789 RepID=UPI003F41AA01
MANMFALVLALATLVTGIVWCFERFKWAPARKARAEAALSAQQDGGAGVVTIKQPGWIETCASVFPVLALVFFVRSFVYEPFQIPSGSMMPTLLIGDFILVEKFAYGIKDPITQTTLIPTGHPRRGDVAVFKYPENPRLDYIKRVIGLPGDRVSYDPLSKQVTVRPACEGSTCDSAVAVIYSNLEASDFVQTFGRPGSESGSGFYALPLGEEKPGGVRMGVCQETLGDVSHRILVVPGSQDQLGMYYQQSRQPLATWVVPNGHYFMMGDNRDNSADSRFWGVVPEKNLVGRATAIWMSFEKQEGKWPTGVRLSRIGRIH